ncbi:MAG TPA: nitrate reductase [Leptolyngbyaceae cyanobacterium M65_K2018_010]|nr:nitrate reductase [Leptolyngbyaceae cyanobacterium M65_K2018_010]
MTSPAKSLCPYCGVGCGLEVVPPKASPEGRTEESPWSVRGDRAHPSSQGMVCVKGATVTAALHTDRLLTPMVRERLDQPFQPISWEGALTLLVQRIQTVLATQGPDGLCMYGSGQLQTEDYYVAQKLLKGCLGTNNFDTNSRLCMSSAVSAYRGSFGSDGPPCCYGDLDLTDCVFLIGTNTAECHPIVFNRLQKRHRRDRSLRVMVVDPRCTATAEEADLHLAIRPGTDIPLLHGMANLLLDWGYADTNFIAQHTQGFTDYQAVLAHYPPAQVAQTCGISLADLEQAARWWGEAGRVLSLWSMGLNQSQEGTAKARSLIDLHLLTGQVGRAGAGPFSLTGQPNAMGGREVGGLCHLLPGYRQVTNPQHRAEVEQVWGLPAGRISPRPGRYGWEMFTGLEAGEVGLLWIVATNPAVSMPDLRRVQTALAQSPFTVYQDCYYPTETAAYAHLLLPAAQWSEKTGVMTNSERVVTLCEGFRPPPGQARPDWEIFAEVGRRLGFAPQFTYESSAAVYREFTRLTRGRLCDQTGISHERLRQAGPCQWPCPAPSLDDQTSFPLGQARLYTDLHFATADGRARFGAYHSRGLAEPPDPDYPYVLTVGRLYGHWHTQSRTGRIAKIAKMYPTPQLEVHPRDAESAKIQDGQWVEVRSRRGAARFQARVTTAITPGTLFAPLHWGALWAEQSEANALTHAIACPESHQPELKACAVQLIPLVPTVMAALETVLW